MKKNWFKLLCYATSVLLALIFIALYVQLNRYENTKYSDYRYDRLTNTYVKIKSPTS